MTDRVRSQVSVDDEDGRHMATADIEVVDQSEVRASLHVESGHLPVGTGARLVDAVLAHPDVDHADRMVATMPLGDVEMLQRVRERCDDVQTHAAGATKLVEARVTHQVPTPR